MDKRVAKIVSIFFIAVSVVTFAYGMSFYYRDFPSTPQPDKGRIYALNNHGYYTYLTRREHIEFEVATAVFLVPFAIAALIDHFIDPFDRRARGY